jgi:hypothetical protein
MVLESSKVMILVTKTQARLTILFLALVLAAGGCAPLQPPSAAGPKGNESVYPVLFAEDSQRREAAELALNQLVQQPPNSATAGPELQPITATIRSLPANPNRSLYLPKVGADPIMNEEDTRESLRRFIRDSRELLGSDPAKLSLIDNVTQPDGSKLATYEQRPFRYPIRGNYGKLAILFATDRRIINIVSSCIPQADHIQAAFTALNVRPKAEDAIKQLRATGIVYTDANGKTATVLVPANNELTARGLVIYVLPSKAHPDTLEFHLAWEIQPGVGSIKTAYVDAINGETIAVE